VLAAHRGYHPFVGGDCGQVLTRSDDGRWIASDSRDASVIRFILHDAATGAFIRSRRGSFPPSSLVFSPDGLRLVTCGSDSHRKADLTIWDIQTGEEVRSLPAAAGGLVEVGAAFSPDGKRLLVSKEGRAEVWDAGLKQRLFAVGVKGASHRVAWAPDGKRLAVGKTAGGVVVCGADDGVPRLTLPGLAGPLTFSPDGLRLAAVSGRAVAVCSIDPPRQVFRLVGHAKEVRQISFSPDGHWLASVDSERVRLWEARTGKEVYWFGGRPGERPNSPCLFSHDGRRLLTGGWGNGPGAGLRSWDLAVSPQRRHDWDTREVVERLFARHLLRQEVVEQLRHSKELSEGRRRAALRLARVFPEDAEDLAAAAWRVAQTPFTSAEECGRALRLTEAARRLEPDNLDHVVVLAALRYRLGEYGKALPMLLRAQVGYAQRRMGGPHFDDALACLALTYHRLGQRDQALAARRRLEKAGKPLTALHREALAVVPDRPQQ
jgi:hypothetical protein